MSEVSSTNVAIIGAGFIAAKMTRTVAALDETELYAVASRSLDKARAFADKFGVQKAYGSYDELLADDAIDLVYVALPHSHHHEWTIKALRAGKANTSFAKNRLPSTPLKLRK